MDAPIQMSTPRVGLGDRVRFRDAYVPAVGTVVDELTEIYVCVKWEGVAAPTSHRREDLQIAA